MFTTLDRCFSTTYSQHDASPLFTNTPPRHQPLSLAMPLLFFLLLSATQHYPLYGTTIPEHDHGSHASVYFTPGTCFRSPPRLHLLAALPCNLFAQPPTFLSFTRHHMRLHAHGIHFVHYFICLSTHTLYAPSCSWYSSTSPHICRLYAHGTAYHLLHTFCLYLPLLYAPACSRHSPTSPPLYYLHAHGSAYHLFHLLTVQPYSICACMLTARSHLPTAIPSAFSRHRSSFAISTPSPSS